MAIVDSAIKTEKDKWGVKLLYLESFERVKWMPNFSSSGLNSPNWTKLLCKGVQLCNSIEDIDWEVNPVQAEICDACGTVGCASGGYIKISKFGDYLIWTRPDKENFDEFQEAQFTPSWTLLNHGPIIIPIEQWKKLNLPTLTTYPDTTRADIVDAWLLDTRGFMQINAIEDLVPSLQENLIASDTMTVLEVINVMKSLVNWVISSPNGSVSGSVEKVDKLHMEILYFDGPKAEDWPAFVRKDGKMFLGLRDEWMFNITQLQLVNY